MHVAPPHVGRIEGNMVSRVAILGSAQVEAVETPKRADAKRAARMMRFILMKWWLHEEKGTV